MPIPVHVFRYIAFIDIACCLLLVLLTLTQSEPEDFAGILRSLLSYGLIAISVLVIQALAFFVKLYFGWDLIEQYRSKLTQQRVRASFSLLLIAFFLSALNGLLVNVELKAINTLLSSLFLIAITLSHIVLITAISLETAPKSRTKSRALLYAHYGMTGLVSILALSHVSGLLSFSLSTTLTVGAGVVIAWRCSFIRLTICHFD